MARFILSATLLLILNHSLQANGHSYLTLPVPISNVEQCRVGGPPGFEENCPGPCPNYGIRNDTAPDMPTIKYSRGQKVEIRYTKNNHFDGFLRFSLVPLDEMWDKEAHAKYAFHFGCWSSNQFSCNGYEKHRDCHHDFDNLGYKVEIAVPKIYPDGVYVLGFVWYGGGRGLDSFGDYYDCSYVEIQGGDYEQETTAVFDSPSGFCDSQTDKIGDCAVEPCYDLVTEPRKPVEFLGEPPKLHSYWFEEAANRDGNKVIVSRHEDFGVTGLRLIDSAFEKPMDANFREIIYLGATDKISFEPITFGTITYVQWFVNGKYQHDAKSFPWSIADHELTDKGVDYYDWIFPYLDERCYITVVVYNEGRRSYFSQEFSFLPKHSA